MGRLEPTSSDHTLREHSVEELTTALLRCSLAECGRQLLLLAVCCSVADHGTVPTRLTNPLAWPNICGLPMLHW